MKKFRSQAWSIEGKWQMQTAAELLASLGDAIEAIKAHLTIVDGLKLQALLAALPSKSPAGSAEMMMRILVYREIEKRDPGEVRPFTPVRQ